MRQYSSFKQKVLVGLFLIFTTISLTSMAPFEAYDPSGVWNYEIETGESVLTGVITIKKVKDSFEVNIESDVYGNLSLESVKLKKQILTGNIKVQGIPTDFEMEFDNDKMSGAVYYDGMKLPLSAKRK